MAEYHCPRCGEVLTMLLAQTRLCWYCYQAAIRQVPRSQVVDEQREFLRQATDEQQKKEQARG